MLLNILRDLRARFMRFILPKENYYLFKPKKELYPLSRKYGFDRGMPIDRYYVEKFLTENRKFIRGRCLEVHDNYYTKKYGKDIKSDVIDINKNNKKANIHADLRKLENVKDNTYDCIIFTHTLGVIDDYESAIQEVLRVLKPDGKLLITASSINAAHDIKNNYWRFTKASFEYIFSKRPIKNLFIKTYGNVLSGQAFWVGAAAEELTKKELDHNDPHYPIIVTAKVTK